MDKVLVSNFMADVVKLPGVRAAEITDTWRDGYFQVSVYLKSSLFDMVLRKNAPHNKVHRIPELGKTALDLRKILKTHRALSLESFEAPKKVYEYLSQEDKSFGATQDSGYLTNSITIQLYV